MLAVTEPPKEPLAAVPETPKKIEPTRDEKVEKLFIQEMGFTMIVKSMIQRQIPLIGHNPMYDILYFYNQFLGPLPSTYLEFIATWSVLFPVMYDSKVACYLNKDVFTNSMLEKLYEQTEKDEVVKGLIKFKFDEKHQMTKYIPQKEEVKQEELPPKKEEAKVEVAKPEPVG